MTSRRLPGLAATLAVATLVLALGTPTAADDAVAPVIRSIVDAAVHPDLRWPRFPDYQRYVQRLYEPLGYQPLWTRGGKPTPQARAITASFLEADARGLSSADYDAERLTAETARLEAQEATTPDAIGRFDAALTVCLMRYVSDSYIGRINPHRVGFGLDVEPKKLDLPVLVGELAASSAPEQRLAALDPPFPFFERLRGALDRMRRLALRTDLPELAALPSLHPGDAHEGVPALRAWLAALGDIAAGTEAPADPTRYDTALAEAVKRFQARHGRDADGVIGPATLRDLRVPVRDRILQIQLAMERLRWLPASFSGRFIVVNIPEFRLRGFEAGQPGTRVAMDVVVGSAARRTETPIMHADMQYVVFRPYWNVPSRIARGEILPRAGRDPGYLARQNMEAVGGRVRQRPGPNNALGLVKFIFPNDFHVYMHDTPSKEYFARSRRDFSHGCIRVADPPRLAEFVLGWDRARITQAMERGPNDRRVNLPAPVPVFLFYTTIVAEEDGRVLFFDDIYGHDARLARELEKGYPYPV
jgi:murein L,D-transpeptidase YcbB/YkuD